MIVSISSICNTQESQQCDYQHSLSLLLATLSHIDHAFPNISELRKHNTLSPHLLKAILPTPLLFSKQQSLSHVITYEQLMLRKRPM
ncbi:unnamed protein product [Onchocerca flexuosa]|uniref:Ovule protein n=1 Tax=Onchocerca flexuosa TaxID=387005 RepID=A0A183I6Y7_9BILA|nr:unnamed protein product [Onchocerca flexuosa]